MEHVMELIYTMQLVHQINQASEEQRESMKVQSRKITIKIVDYKTKSRNTRTNDKKMNPFCVVQIGPHKTYSTPVI